MKLTQMLASRNYIILNKPIAKILGINASIMLGELCSEYEYWKSTDQLDEEYFYSTAQNIREHTTLTRKSQDSAIGKLKEYGIIETKLMGLPAKRYFKINQEKIGELLYMQDCPSGTN